MSKISFRFHKKQSEFLSRPTLLRIDRSYAKYKQTFTKRTFIITVQSYWLIDQRNDDGFIII